MFVAYAIVFLTGRALYAVHRSCVAGRARRLTTSLHSCQLSQEQRPQPPQSQPIASRVSRLARVAVPRLHPAAIRVSTHTHAFSMQSHPYMAWTRMRVVVPHPVARPKPVSIVQSQSFQRSVVLTRRRTHPRALLNGTACILCCCVSASPARDLIARALIARALAALPPCAHSLTPPIIHPRGSEDLVPTASGSLSLSRSLSFSLSPSCSPTLPPPPLSRRHPVSTSPQLSCRSLASTGACPSLHRPACCPPVCESREPREAFHGSLTSSL